MKILIINNKNINNNQILTLILHFNNKNNKNSLIKNKSTPN